MVQGICVGFPEAVMLGLKEVREMSENMPGKGYAVWFGEHHKQREQQMYRPWAGRESGHFTEKACVVRTKSEGKEGVRKTQELVGTEHTEPLAFSLR